MSQGHLEWYARRIGKMSAREVIWRLHDSVQHRAWASRQVPQGSPSQGTPSQGSPAQGSRGLLAASPAFTAVLGPETSEQIPDSARASLFAAADELLAGHGEILGVERTDLARPDWFFDPVTGRQAPARTYAFAIDHRSEAVTGNVKQVWELSRLQHLTVLSAAWCAGGSDDYADAVAAQLRSWWAANPFLSGINWTSGIELGIRLISWVWVRRLLDGWQGVAELFERNREALAQISWHQQYLATFRSRGSSANNHVIAEAAGQLIASLAFPWFESSERWRRQATSLLESQLALNTFDSGLNREQASSYHLFVAELGLLAASEASACGHPLSHRTWDCLARTLDAALGVLDSTGRPPRQGDGDDGRALVVDPPATDPWASLAATGASLVGPLSWWPEVRPTTMSVLVGGLFSGGPVSSGPVSSGPGSPHGGARRSQVRPSHFEDAGLTLLRSPIDEVPEIWCRCDAGPHGFLSIAAHAHADALSVEVRYGGVDILADPGTYCYHGEAEWRRYFRSTVAHNTVEIAGEDQSVSGGPFLWLRQARTTGAQIGYDSNGEPRRWAASHDGYGRLHPPVAHRRIVTLDDRARQLDIVDEIDTSGVHLIRLAFHLGPLVSVELDGTTARLDWPVASSHAAARLDLPGDLAWTAHRGETEPVLGWYSAGFGLKEPSVTVLGRGESRPGRTELRSVLTFS